jgi:hypothetical protein
MALQLTISACAAITACTLFELPGPAWAENSAVPGHVVLARTGDDALAIWDSTPEVAAIVSVKLGEADAKARLERDALRVLAQVQPKISSSAKTISVRIIYSKTGDVSPVYGSATFAGVERYAILKVNAVDAATDRDKWKELGDGAAPPTWVQFDIVGELPPR